MASSVEVTPSPEDMKTEPPPPGSGAPGAGTRRMLGLALGPLILVLMLILPIPEGMTDVGWRTAAVGVLMATWWVTEAIPIPGTALIPLVLFPMLGIASMRDAATPYANSTIFLFLGGFVLALAMERWGVHRRVALSVVRAIGVKPHTVVLGIMVATAFLSMWVSNTATAVMMLPIGLSIVQLVRPDAEYGQGAPMDFNFATCLMLGIGYSASIGGLGTLIGTPPNALLAGFMSEAYGMEIGFAQWMLVGVPLVVVTLPLAWIVLTRFVFPIQIKEIPGGRAAIDREYRKLGIITRPEKWVIAVFVLTAGLWISRPALVHLVPGLDDGGIAILAAILLFAIPIDRRGSDFVMTWEAAEKLPWGVLVLFGGGLSLADAVQKSGLAEWLATAISTVPIPTVGMVLLIIVVIMFLTEFTSNTATAAAFLPLVGSIAVGFGENPLLMTIPAALAASCAFMMPVATPPNAVVYGSGYVTILQMVRGGFWLNTSFVVAILILTYTLVLAVFGVTPGEVPAWAVS